MRGSLRFRFELRPVADIAPWGTLGNRSLSWFGLTDGWQCLETAVGRLLEYARPFEPRGSRWVDYQVVRLFEDLLEIWPWVSDSVPEDVASRFFGWYSAAEASRIASMADPDTQELWLEACAWWHNRQLQFHQLILAPELHFWRTGSEVNLLWDATGMDAAGPRWAVQHARLTAPFEEAQRAVEDFCQALLSAMAERVAAIERDVWTRPECSLDVAKVVAEQHERETWQAANLSRTFETDWDAIRQLQEKVSMGGAAADLVLSLRPQRPAQPDPSHKPCAEPHGLASVSTTVRPFSNILRQASAPVSINVRRKPSLIAG